MRDKEDDVEKKICVYWHLHIYRYEDKFQMFEDIRLG